MAVRDGPALDFPVPVVVTQMPLYWHRSGSWVPTTLKVTGHVPLRRGLHKISLRYYQSEGGAALSVGWAAEDDELQPLAGAALFH